MTCLLADIRPVGDVSIRIYQKTSDTITFEDFFLSGIDGKTIAIPLFVDEADEANNIYHMELRKQGYVTLLIQDIHIFAISQLLHAYMIPTSKERCVTIQQKSKKPTSCASLLSLLQTSVARNISTLPEKLMVPMQGHAIATMYTIEYIKYLANACIYPTWPIRQQQDILFILSGILFQNDQLMLPAKDPFIYHVMQIQSAPINHMVDQLYGTYAQINNAEQIQFAKLQLEGSIKQVHDTLFRESLVSLTPENHTPSLIQVQQLMAKDLSALQQLTIGSKAWISCVQQHFDLADTGVMNDATSIHMAALIQRYGLLDQLYEQRALITKDAFAYLWFTPICLIDVCYPAHNSHHNLDLLSDGLEALQTWKPETLSPPALTLPIKLHAHHPQVQVLQHLINQLSNYYPAITEVVEDGYFGKRSETAIKTLQRMLGSEETAQVSDALWQTLHTLVHQLTYAYPQDTHLPFYKTTPSDTLQPTQIQAIQACLSAISTAYPSIPDTIIDGVYGQGTRASIIAFQQLLGLVVNGLPDAQTIRQLQQLYAELQIKM